MTTAVLDHIESVLGPDLQQWPCMDAEERPQVQAGSVLSGPFLHTSSQPPDTHS